MLHATLSASGSERWMECPGSIRLSQGMPRKDTLWSATGTVAHSVGAECLQKGLAHASIFLGKVYSEGKFSIEVDEDMVEGVQLYVDFVRETLSKLPLSNLDVEKKFKLDWLHEGLWGTNDACVVQPYGDLVVIDYKNGSGVLVDPQENSQLMYYGVGRIGKDNEECFDKVTLCIVQPHAKGAKIKQWSTSADYLIAWSREKLLAAAHAALQEDAPLHSGPHCKFCPASPLCPEKRRESCRTAGVVFAEQALDPVPTQFILPAPDVMTKEQLCRVIDGSDELSDWIKQVEVFVRNQLEAGAEGYRYKLVEGRKSNRKWNEEIDVERQLVAKYKAKAYEQKLLSPAKMEKVIKEFGEDPETVLKPFIAEQTKSKVLVPADDERPGIQASAKQTFGELKE